MLSGSFAVDPEDLLVDLLLRLRRVKYDDPLREARG